jgi:hypothetical protein
MIDTEFLSLRYDAQILSIGAVAWDMGEPVFDVKNNKHLHVFPDMDSQTCYGAKVDRETLLWWLGQDPEPQAEIIRGQRYNHITIREALVQLSYFILEKAEITRIWSHGAVCDLALLKHWYDKIELPVPWQYQTPRDTRTLFDVVGHTPQKNFHGNVEHDALADAVAQAEQVHTAWRMGHGSV